MPRPMKSCWLCRFMVKEHKGLRGDHHQCDAPLPNCLINMECGFIDPEVDGVDCDCFTPSESG